ncbi:MAG: hypothetical protein F2873_06955 [Actinobacteria bacterium]|uniref:Unannotated protein n=1 Tax=freshwater metagenome TaxID=449393 RepID=A0A6J7NPG8_9ZZZZ|nr:hypothetical protein [Actinomycetota bacterium]MSX80332.1 hypothetical protein [Actinomycetota bacterium]
MSLPLDIARSHLETLIERLTRSEKAVPDKEGDYLVVTERAQFFARVDGPEQPVIRLFSVMARNIDKTPELLEALNSINSHLTFLRTMWIEQQVLMEADLLAMSSDIGDFADACRRVALTSDHFGPDLIKSFGGEPMFETSKEAGYSPEPPNYFGYL